MENKLGWTNLSRCDQRCVFNQIVDNEQTRTVRDHILDEMRVRNYLTQTQITDFWSERNLGNGRGGDWTLDESSGGRDDMRLGGKYGLIYYNSDRGR